MSCFERCLSLHFPDGLWQRDGFITITPPISTSIVMMPSCAPVFANISIVEQHNIGLCRLRLTDDFHDLLRPHQLSAIEVTNPHRKASRRMANENCANLFQNRAS